MREVQAPLISSEHRIMSVKRRKNKSAHSTACELATFFGSMLIKYTLRMTSHERISMSQFSSSEIENFPPSSGSRKTSSVLHSTVHTAASQSFSETASSAESRSSIAARTRLFLSSIASITQHTALVLRPRTRRAAGAACAPRPPRPSEGRRRWPACPGSARPRPSTAPPRPCP